jgi:3-hydroxybutyryl-CoA dehydratase
MEARIGKTVSQIAVGDEAYCAKTLTETDMMLFAGITGDLNQLPINDQFARKTRYGQRIAHGMLTASFVTNILGMKLPGFGTVLRSFKVRFTAPVFLNDTVEVGIRVSATNVAGNTVTLDTWAVNQQGQTVMQGSCVVAPPLKLEHD